MAELSEKFQQHPEEDVAYRIIEPTKEVLETTSEQEKIDPVITTKEAAVTTDTDLEMKHPSPTSTSVQDESVQTFVPIKRRRCSNCCGGLPGRGPGLGRGCDGGCSCIPDIRIREGRNCEEEFHSRDSTGKLEYPRLFITRHCRNRLRGGGSGDDGDDVLDSDSRKTKIPRMSRVKEEKVSLSGASSIERPKEGSIGEAKEHRSHGGFRRSLSSLRGQLPRWEKARESCWESCFHGGRLRSGKNCVGRDTVSAECVPRSYNSVTGVRPGIFEDPRNFRRKQNVMAVATAVVVEGTKRTEKLCQGTTGSRLVALSVTTSKCVWKGLLDHVEDKCRQSLPWERTSLAFERGGRSESSSLGNFLSSSRLARNVLRGRRNDRPDGYSLNADPDKTVSRTSDVRQCFSTENCFYLSPEILRGKTLKNYNFSKQRRSFGQNLRRRPSKREENVGERLRGGGSSLDLMAKCKTRQEIVREDECDTNDDIDDWVISRKTEDDDEDERMTSTERIHESEHPWSQDVTNERVIRFREDQECCGSSEDQNEDGRVRGGCGGSYKPGQHSFFANCSSMLARRDTEPRGSCCSPPRPQSSCRSAHSRRPPPCQKSSGGCPGRSQHHTSCGRIDPCCDVRVSCPCNSCGGAACSDEYDFVEINRCCKPQQRERYPCQCKCQTCKGFRSCGGCGGQFCGRIYSCSGSVGGTCCFPRNTGRRAGPECCGGGNSNCGGCC